MNEKKLIYKMCLFSNDLKWEQQVTKATKFAKLKVDKNQELICACLDPEIAKSQKRKVAKTEFFH